MYSSYRQIKSHGQKILLRIDNGDTDVFDVVFANQRWGYPIHPLLCCISTADASTSSNSGNGSGSTTGPRLPCPHIFPSSQDIHLLTTHAGRNDAMYPLPYSPPSQSSAMSARDDKDNDDQIHSHFVANMEIMAWLQNRHRNDKWTANTYPDNIQESEVRNAASSLCLLRQQDDS
jgi:hypothetical protein